MEGMQPQEEREEERARGPASRGSSTGPGAGATWAAGTGSPADAAHGWVEEAVERVTDEAAEVVHTLEEIFSPPVRRGRVWQGAGLRERAERWFEGVAWAVVLLLGAGWAWSIAEARTAGAADRTAARRPAPGVTPATAAVTAAFTDPDRPTTAYLTDAAMTAVAELRGASGAVRLVQRAPGEPVARDSRVTTAESGEVASGRDAGGRPVAVRVGDAVRPVQGLRVVTLTPLSARRNGRIGLYYIGTWPTERGRAPSPAYAPPRGLIEVTRETQDTPVSAHLRIRDYLTHDQADVWPKYVVIDPRNVDKVELVLADLARRGVPARGVHVMSGFRTPRYNNAGGDTRGRAGLSRHMYGDATDFWIDNDGDGRMDDLNRDGRHDLGDAKYVCDAVDRVEQAHPALVGGCGYYPATGAHGPFTHIDARGYRARWIGSGDGG